MEVPGHDRASSGPKAEVALVASAREVAAQLAKRLARRPGAPVRATFVSLPPAPDDRAVETPALARLLRGGRGGEVKVKILISALWISASAPYDVSLPGRAWAQLIGLPDPTGRGAHRVNNAVRQLVAQNFLSVEHRPGDTSRLFLLNETGDGTPYTPPGERVAQLRRADKDFEPHRYFRVPHQLWTQGWIAALHGPAIAMLLVLLSHASGRDPHDLWFSPEVADRRFHLSAETRKRGFDRLRDEGLITVHRRPVTRTLDTTRLRNTYTLNLDVLTGSRPDQ